MRRYLGVILTVVLVGLAEGGQLIQLQLPGMGSTGPYLLGYEHILTGSEQIEYHDSLLTRETDYRLDYNYGVLILNQPVPPTDTLDVQFAVAPIRLKKSYSWMSPVAAPQQGSDTTAFADDPPSLGPRMWNSQLDIVGSKGFAINVGNIGEPALTQSLDLDITGQITSDVYLRGSISDRNFGQSSGATRSLDELDKIFVTVEAKNFRGDFGDLELHGVPNSLLDFQRKLTGLSVSGRSGDYHGSTALAFSPGQQIELFFYGVDGKQGPYLLTSSSSSNPTLDQVFLPGTEEVYLDGIRLKRGTENDYTIDYYERYINFTPKRLITSRSRITVKIQIAPEGYRRSFYNASFFSDKKVSVGFQYVGDKDDKNNPRNFDLGESERQAISRAGGFQDSAFVSGVKYAGDSLGYYVQSVDSLGHPYYEYAGFNRGDYIVSFSRVGDGLGEYEYAGADKYVYVGQGNGAYLPRIYYPLPESRDYGSIIVKADGNLHLGSEFAFSRFDRNMLSQQDDPLNGLGFLGDAGWKVPERQWGGKTWDINLFSLQARVLNDQFTVPGILDRPEFFRDYNLPQDRPAVGEKLFEFQTGAASDRGDRLAAGGGVFEDSDYRAHRALGQLNYIVLGNFQLTANTELTSSKNKATQRISDWNKYDAGISYIKGGLQPGVKLSHELNDGLLSSADGYRSTEYESFVNTYIIRNIETGSKVIFRRQDYFAQDSDSWAKQFDQYQLMQNIKYTSKSSGLNGELTVSRLYQKSVYPADEKLTRNIGDLKVNYNSDDVGVTFYESINGTGQLNRAREYVFVGEGKGDFRKDGEDYVPEPGGDYIEVIRQLGEGSPDLLSGYEVSGGVRLRLQARAFAEQPWAKNLSLDSDLSHRTNFNSSAGLKFNSLNPFQSFSSSDMTYKSYDYRQLITYRLSVRGDYIRHTFKSSRNDGADYEFESLNDKSLSNALDLKVLSGQEVSLLFSGERASENRQLYSGLVELSRYKVGLTPEYHPNNSISVGVPFAYASEDEKLQNYNIKSYTTGLKTVVNFHQTGRFELNGQYTRVNTQSDAFIPYVAAGGNKKGNNFSGYATARFKLNSYSHLEFRYSYRRLGDGYSNSNLRLEAKAEF